MSKTSLIIAAEYVGFELCREAFWFEDRCTWQTDTMRGNNVSLQTCDPFLYEGLAGIALFLSHLYAFSNDKVFKETALGALNQMIEMLDGSESKSAGFYVGETGCAYTLYAASTLLDKPELRQVGQEMLMRLFHKTIANQSADIVSGYAGQILGILRCIPQPDPITSHHLSCLLDAMMDKSTRVGNSLMWSDPKYPAREALTGYSHGNAGIAAALAGLKSVGIGDIDRKHINEIVQYESDHFVEDKGNWCDFRFNQTVDARCSTTWCHGAPGILLSRIKLFHVFKDDTYLEQIKIAISTVEKHFNENKNSSKSNLSLCHGLYGNLDSLLCAANVESSGISLSKVRDYASKIILNARDDVYDCEYGVHAHDAFVPGLMGGESGVGYSFLRLHSPELVPSVLGL
ncbi:lanthionine synthetase LanC family protein [Enterovibrio calviensis]|uniref:lanthionine synthetase LanC family protein n=1 Tax=Enterovibrio calviensis TaxID=91359 RepID=UPI0037365222